MKIVVEMPDNAFSSLRTSPADFAQELKLAACVKWHELGKLSQAKASEMAGLSRTSFIEALHRHRVPAIQTVAGTLREEMSA